MYTLITIFYVSILAMLAMVLFKRREVMTGEASVVSRIGAGTDHVFSAVFVFCRKYLAYANRRNLVLVMHWLAFHILKFVRGIYVELKAQTLAHPTGKRLIDAVRGRGDVKSTGASFYLRRISADQSIK